MREIIFKARRKDTGEWVYGAYGVLGKDTDVERHVIMLSTLSTLHDDYFYFTDIEIIPETVCQFTGLTDKSGVKIFEGDIVTCINYHGKVEGSIGYSTSKFYLSCSSGYSDEYLFNCSEIEVIGNIYDKEV